MAERKVINKYYPPDFDPSKVPRRRKKGTPQLKVRMMMPMSVQCTNCGEYLYQGKKFNSRKETCWDESYLGLKVFRFYIKCPRCSAELTMKTNPKDSRYDCEHNCTRNFEAWNDPKIEEEQLQKEQEDKEGELDSMKLLENKSNVTKHEMDLIDDLDEIKSLKSMNEMVSVDNLLELHHQKILKQQEEEKQKEVDLEEDMKEFYNGVKRVQEKPKKPATPSENSKNEKRKFDLLEMAAPEVVIVAKKKKKKAPGALVDY
jgi:hypothetical protein